MTNFEWKAVVPKGSRNEVLKECHDDPKSAHLGVQKTIDRVLDRYYWPGLSRDVKLYVKGCRVCRMSKHDNVKPPGFMGKFRKARMPWQMISMDLLGPFPRSKAGNTSLLVISDWITKYPCLIPLRRAQAKDVVKNVEQKIFLEFSVPETVIMDNGSQFARSKELKALLKKYGISRLWSNCIYHAQSNFTERHNKNINAALRAYIKDNHKTWDGNLPEIALALKTAVHAVTEYSPFFLNHGREYVFHAADYSLLGDFETDEDPVTQRSKFIDRFKEIFFDIQSRIRSAYEKNKKYYDKNRSELHFEQGDEIYYRNHVKSDAIKNISNKLAPVYLPGIIDDVVSKVAYLIKDELGNDVGKVHVQDLRPRFILDNVDQ